jgi:hypothetical protein
VLDIDLAFPHSYDVQEVGELPGTGKFAAPLIFFPEPKTRPEHDGLWLKVKMAGGAAWIGVFAYGYQSPPALTRVISSPDPDRLCVVAKGSAYFVRAGEPKDWIQIPVFPVIDVRPLPEDNLLVFSDFVKLAAFGSRGVAWQSPRVCWDGLKITGVNRETIEGTGYDPVNSRESRFVVDVKTGKSLLPAPTSSEGKPLW